MYGPFFPPSAILPKKNLTLMTRKRKLDSRVVVVSEDEQPTTESSDSEDEISEDDEEEHKDEGEDEGEDESEDEDEDESEDESEDELEGDEDEENDKVEDEENDKVEDEEEDFSSKESIRKLLEPFGKDQLIEIFKEAVLKNPSLLSHVVNEAEADPVHRKIFVHGLGLDVTSEALIAAFSPFGKIEDCNVVINHATGRCRGYGFVLFRSRFAAQRALKEPLKNIGGRIVKCCLASSGTLAAAGQASSEVTGRKLYVNNVGSNVNPERLFAFFSKFGKIERGPIGFDSTKGMFRGHAIFFYKTVEGLNKALEEPRKHFEGCNLHCQKGVEGPINNNIATETVPTGMQANDFALGYASAVALMGQNLAPRPTTVIGPGVGVGLLNPVAGLSSALSERSVGVTQQPYTVGGAGIPPQSYAVGPVGSANRVSGIGVNSISPSVIANYGSLAALHGMGAYQNSASSTDMRPQSGLGSLGASFHRR